MAPDPSSAPECFTDFALQEFISGRLDPAVRTSVAEHLAACGECRQALAAFEAEAHSLGSALAPLNPKVPDDSSISDETLGLYLAGALDAPQTLELETRMLHDFQLLQRMLALQAEIVAVRAEIEGRTTFEATVPEPMGRILRMPKRIKPVTTVLNADRHASGDVG